MPSQRTQSRIVVIWIDWYPYHAARFSGLCSVSGLSRQMSGIELVGGIGVHAGLKFREDLPADLAVDTLMPQSSWREANKFNLSLKLWRKLSDLSPSTVLVPGYYTLPGIAAALWARTHRVQSVLMTESAAFDHPRVAWKEWIKRTALRMLFNWAIAGGKAHFDYLRQLGFPMNRVTGYYDVVNNQLFRDGTAVLRSQGQATAQVPYFLYVGRLAEEKNVSGLLDSWIAYRNGGGTWPLVLVGDGPESTALRNAAAASAYNKDVHFPGLKASRELLPFYAHAGCFVLPSTREPWGLVVNEAMAAGLPVLVSNRCGCAMDLVKSGRNGFVFDPSDGRTLTNLLRSVEDLPLSKRRSMGDLSEKIIRDYSPLAFGNSVITIAANGGKYTRIPLRDAVGSAPLSGGSR